MNMEEIKNIKSEKSDIRKFGITIGIVLSLLGGLLLWHKKDYYLYFFAFSTIFVFLALTLPIILKPIHKIWMTFAIFLGWLMTRVILAILFYLMITSIALIAKLVGKQFLELKWNKSQNSYWNYRTAKIIDKSDYERQF